MFLSSKLGKFILFLTQPLLRKKHHKGRIFYFHTWGHHKTLELNISHPKGFGVIYKLQKRQYCVTVAIKAIQQTLT